MFPVKIGKKAAIDDNYCTTSKCFLPRDASAECGDATVSRPSVCDV